MTDIERGLAIRILSCRRSGFQTGQIVGRRRSRCAFALEAAVNATMPGEDGIRRIDEATVIEALGRAQYAYDKGGGPL